MRHQPVRSVKPAIFANAAASSDAPPTKAPSTSAMAMSASMVAGVTEPPYNTRQPSAAKGACVLGEDRT